MSLPCIDGCVQSLRTSKLRMAMSDLNLAVIGNCSYGALIDRVGRVVWACVPHFDGDSAMRLSRDWGEAS